MTGNDLQRMFSGESAEAVRQAASTAPPEAVFVREPRYVVLKVTDMAAAQLTDTERAAFNAVCDKVSRARICRGKDGLECVVVEKDWPEYEPTWLAIEQRTRSSHDAARCPKCGASGLTMAVVCGCCGEPR